MSGMCNYPFMRKGISWNFVLELAEYVFSLRALQWARLHQLPNVSICWAATSFVKLFIVSGALAHKLIINGGLVLGLYFIQPCFALMD